MFVDCYGVFEEIIIGVYYFYCMFKEGKFFVFVINVNDFVIKFKFDNLYGCCEFFIDGIKCVIDVMIVGKIGVVVGFGDVGKGCVFVFQGMGVCVFVIEVDFINVFQVVMVGFQVIIMEKVVKVGQIFVIIIGCCDILVGKYFEVMFNDVIVCSMFRFLCFLSF